MGDTTRRKFVTTVAGTGAALTIVPRHVLGRGMQAPERHREHRGGRARHGCEQRRALMSENLVALCDVQIR